MSNHRRVATIMMLVLGSSCRHGLRPTTTSTPATVAASLLAADRAYAQGAGSRPLPAAIGAMLTDGAMMPVRGEILEGRDRIVAALGATADSTSRATWTPITAGISADGQHAFTVGFLIATRADGTRVPFKYLAYWVRQRVSSDRRDDGAVWRVAAWRRRPMEPVAIDSTALPPLVPRRLVAPTRDPAIIAAHVASLRAAESEFSALANRIGVGAAFAQRGTPASLNVGPPGEGRFTRGADAIARVVAGGQPLDLPSPITWSADTALVASSGDLGITFGVIRPKGASPTAAGSAFFTIWRREPAGWRYVAE